MLHFIDMQRTTGGRWDYKNSRNSVFTGVSKFKKNLDLRY
jgi:hypothetical protein